MDLAVLMENQVKGMGRYHKYTLGGELRSRAMASLSLVVRANSTANKVPVLEELGTVLEELRQLLFLAKETKALHSFGFYKDAMEKLENISRQSEGWKRSQLKKQSK